MSKSLKILLPRLAAACLFLFVAGCSTLPQGSSRICLKDICSRYALSWNKDDVSGVVTLRKGDNKAKALIGSNTVLVGCEQVVLSSALYTQGQSIMVPYDFKKKVIDRLIVETLSIDGRRFRVVIDAGHGGKDPGAIGRSGTQEKTVALDIVKRLEKSLRHKGVSVFLTRKKDTFISLAGRTEIASRANADLFISIHANFDPARRASGVEVYFARAPSYREKKEAQRAKNYRLLFSGLAMKKDSAPARKIVADLLYDHKCSGSAELASLLVRELAKDLRAKNRGAKKAGFFVVRNNLMPAVLVEVGFLSHPREENLLKKSSYRQKIVDSLTESILLYASR